MRGSNRICHRPYIPMDRQEWRRNPYIVRLAPGDGGFTLEALGGTGRITLHVISPEENESIYPMEGTMLSVDSLENDRTYQLFLTDEEGHRSFTRRLIPAPVPEGAVVINYMHPADDQYSFSGHFLCSPSLVRLPDGRLLASMDVFGARQGQVLELLFTSADNGNTWRYLCDLYPFYWGSLFVHRGILYMLGLTTEYGNLQIACSKDGGSSWSSPQTLFYGANTLSANGGIHRSPMQVVEHNGRLYTTCEYGSWSVGRHLPGVLSVDAGADLMDPSAWSCTGFLPFEGAWETASVGKQGDSIEGNILILPDGRISEFLRYKMGEVLMLGIDEADPESLPRFQGVLSWPVSSSMFRVFPYRDEYLLVTNRKTEVAERVGPGIYRNVLSVFRSKTLDRWTFVRDIVNMETEDSGKVGFQYPCTLLEKDELYMSVRSGFNHADSAHNSNYMLFWHVSL